MAAGSSGGEARGFSRPVTDLDLTVRQWQPLRVLNCGMSCLLVFFEGFPTAVWRMKLGRGGHERLRIPVRLHAVVQRERIEA